jgi:hypothetical protein
VILNKLISTKVRKAKFFVFMFQPKIHLVIGERLVSLKGAGTKKTLDRKKGALVNSKELNLQANCSLDLAFYFRASIT